MVDMFSLNIYQKVILKVGKHLSDGFSHYFNGLPRNRFTIAIENDHRQIVDFPIRHGDFL